MAQRAKKSRNRGSVGNNRKTGNDFLDKNAKKEGVVVTESGLQYQVIEKGLGDTVFADANLTVHQRCLLVNGTVVIDTYKENEPAEMAVPELIEGYQEGVMLMNKGARFKFFIPPELAWGKKGTGTKVPPNSVLIFDVRLIDFW